MRLIVLAILATLTTIGCDQSFEPIEPGNRHFSIYGFLDASSDTQWVRVSPLRQRLGTEHVPVDALVTLENLTTGRTVVMNDSLFVYRANNLDLSVDSYAHNFWTTEKVEPGAVYRFTATRPDGSSSTAVVPIPAREPTVVVGIGQSPSWSYLHPDFVRVEEVEHLAMVLVLHHVPETCLVRSHPHRVYHRLDNALSPAEGVHVVNIDRRPDISPLGCPELEKEIYVVSSGSEWPYDPTFSAATAILPDAASNVDDGAGFLGGVFTRTVPYEHCSIRGTPSPGDYCELTYDASSGSLEVAVTDDGCRLSDAGVVVEEVDGSRIRPATLDRSGYYRIGALDPGVRHELRVSHGDAPTFHDTFILVPGQRLRLDVDLELPQLSSC